METSGDGRGGDITALLNEFARGDRSAMQQILPLVYSELHKLARYHRYRWNGHRAPGTTSLVHEAYLKMVDQTHVQWENRRQFYYIASRAMRSILVDNARRFQRQKRGGGQRAIPLDAAILFSEVRSTEVLALDEALDRLLGSDERLGRIVECRFFGGLTVEETAEALDISPATVKRGWNLARAWLYRELSQDSPESRPN
jgi:RNA polymerase sigma factor (TIGR02999 family)